MTINVWNGKNENENAIDNKTINVWIGKNEN